MRFGLVKFVTPAAGIAIATSIAAAQVTNQPVYLSPKHGTGLSVHLDYGRGINDASGKLSAVGGHATLGVAMVTVTAGAASVDVGATRETSLGGTVALNVLSAPLLPIGISVFGGFGTIDVGGGSVKTYPVGAAVAVRPPTPGLGIEVWAAPRLNIVNALGGTVTDIAASGGVNLDLPVGIGLHAAIDWINIDGGAPLVLGVGAHYKFTIPLLGM